MNTLCADSDDKSMGGRALTGYYVVGTLTINLLFLALLLVGWSFGGLGPWRAAAFLSLWVAGYAGLPYLSFGGRVFGAFLIVPYVVLLDAILLIVIFKGADKIT